MECQLHNEQEHRVWDSVLGRQASLMSSLTMADFLNIAKTFHLSVTITALSMSKQDLPLNGHYVHKLESVGFIHMSMNVRSWILCNTRMQHNVTTQRQFCGTVKVKQTQCGATSNAPGKTVMTQLVPNGYAQVFS